MGHWNQAAQSFEKASSLDPQNVDVLHHCSVAYVKLGRYDDAERIVRKGLTIDPDDAQLHASFGEVYEARADAAVGAFKKSKCKRQADQVNRLYRKALSEYRQAVDDAQVGRYAASKVEVVKQKIIPDEELFFANPDC